jgi:alpha-glucosidase
VYDDLFSNRFRETKQTMCAIRKFGLFLAMLAGLALPLAGVTPQLTVKSPDGKIAVNFTIAANPQPYLPGQRAYYSVSFQGQRVLAPSPLGLDFLNAPALDHGFQITATHLDSRDSEWHNDFGERSTVRDRFNQLTVSLQESAEPGRRVDLVFRAYNEGVAFRYILPRQPTIQQFTISSEETGFYFTSPLSAFALKQNSIVGPFEQAYEHMPFDRIKPTSIVCLPLVIQAAPDAWLALMEADLTNYAGMFLSGVEGVPNALHAVLATADRHSDQAVTGTTPISTPWRVIMISATATGLIANDDLVLNLSAPSAIADTSWIQPGKAAWDWWSGDYDTGVSFKPGMNTATMEHYIDFAAENHLEYMLIDAGWSPHDDITKVVPQIDMPGIVAYAHQKNVKVLIWTHWRPTEKQIDQAFPLYEKWGISGVKVDFMGEGPSDQATVNFYEKCVRVAAEHHLVVDIHGAYKPTGLRRTYPNLLTREGVMGMEYSKWSRNATPEHDVTLPFTRMLTGPFDYTPGCFNNATQAQFQPRSVNPMCQGTRAHQLAMYVDFFSPLAMVSDFPEDLNGQPGMEFIAKVPTVWDNTVVLNGEPAQYVTIAREKSGVWYVGSMTNWQPRDLEISLSFLDGKRYQAQIFADGADADQNAKSLAMSKQWVKPADHLKFHLAPGGGWAAILTPAP